MADAETNTDLLTARFLLRHIKPLKLPERLANEPPDTAIFADQDMREALIEREDSLAGRLLPLDSLAGSEFDAKRIVVCALDNGGAPSAPGDEPPDMPVRSLTGDYLLSAAAGLDPWTDLEALEQEPMPASLYGVICLPRSGSTYFCHLLQGLEMIGRPTEHLRPHILFLVEHGPSLGFDPVRWIELIARAGGPGGFFGSKVITDFAVALWALMTDSQRADMMTLLTGAKLIHLERADKVAQSVSQFIADETRIWHVRNKGDEEAYRAAKEAVAYDGERLRSLHTRFTGEERQLAELLQAWPGPVHHLTYETLAGDPQKAVSEAVGFVRNEEARPVDLKHEKYFPMSDRVNQTFAERFRSELGEAD